VSLELARRERPCIIALAIFCAGCYLVSSFTVYAQYLGSGYDLGIFDQAVRAYSHLQAPITPLKARGFDILGDHFHPIIALLGPYYWIWDNPGVLLIAQALLTASSIPVVYRFTRRRAGVGFSWTVAAGYGLAWPIQTMIDVQFHEVAFAVPLLALAIELRGMDSVYALAADSDGIDGTENNAGALIGPDTLSRAQALGLNPEKLLQSHDSYTCFFALNDLLLTGPTLTNVNDYRAILIG